MGFATEHESPADDRPAFSVIVPVYNSAAILPQLVARLIAVIEQLGQSGEIILVDDGSRDGSWETLKELKREHADRLRIFRLSRNFGQHNALMCGFKNSRGCFVVTLDDDLQNPPEEIPRLYAKLREGGYDVVFGYFELRMHGRLRNVTSNLSRWLVRLAVPGIDPHFSNYRIMNQFIAQELARQIHDFVYIDGLIAWVTRNTTHVIVAHERRPIGRSNYSLGRLVAYFAVVVLTFTTLPLRLVSLLGLVTATAGLAVGFVYFVMRLSGLITEPGFAGIAVAVLVLGGIQLLSLGLIGEYLAKMFVKQSGKPQFIVRESCS